MLRLHRFEPPSTKGGVYSVLKFVLHLVTLPSYYQAKPNPKPSPSAYPTLTSSINYSLGSVGSCFPNSYGSINCF